MLNPKNMHSSSTEKSKAINIDVSGDTRHCSRGMSIPAAFCVVENVHRICTRIFMVRHLLILNIWRTEFDVRHLAFTCLFTTLVGACLSLSLSFSLSLYIYFILIYRGGPGSSTLCARFLAPSWLLQIRCCQKRTQARSNLCQFLNQKCTHFPHSPCMEIASCDITKHFQPTRFRWPRAFDQLRMYWTAKKMLTS